VDTGDGPVCGKVSEDAPHHPAISNSRVQRVRENKYRYTTFAAEPRDNAIPQDTMPKPIVLHLGDAIKYSHDLYNQQFAQRFEVVRNTATNREEFLQALKQNK
jgi:hypothetical protein